MKPLIFVFVIFSLLFSIRSQACSAFFLSRENVKVLGKNHDFRTGKGYIIVHRKGVKKTAKIYVKGLKNITPVTWTSKYDNITFHAAEKPDAFMPIDGMNSQGLAVSELYVDDNDSTNKSFNNTRQALMCSIWVSYLLDNYKDVDEIICNITKLRLINTFHAHWFACDKSGNSAVFEYVNGNLVICYGQPLTFPGITNHIYIYSCKKLEKFLSSNKNLPPKGHKSIQRFIRGITRLSKYTNENPVKFMHKLMKNVSRPEFTDTPTRWTSIYDLKNRKIYYELSETNILHKIDFKKETQKTNDTIIRKFDTLKKRQNE